MTRIYLSDVEAIKALAPTTAADVIADWRRLAEKWGENDRSAAEEAA